MKTKTSLGIIGIWFSLIATFLLFLLSKIITSGGTFFPWLYLSQIFSLLGVTLLCLSFVLSGRWRFMEGWFGGLDKVYRTHHILGGLSFVLILHHPLLLVIEVLPDYNFAWKYLWFSDLPPYNYGVMGLYFLVLMLSLTLLLNLPYSIWKKTHEYMGIALIFVTLHVFTIYSDVSRFLPLRLWIFLLLGLAFISVIYRRFLYEHMGQKFKYKIKKITRKENLFLVEMTPVGSKIKFSPGQFIFTRFEDLGRELHPFSIANGANEPALRLVVKILGDYTRLLGQLKPGDLVTLWGPYGQFGVGAANEKDLIWIAGGIGVTPFLSLLIDEVQNTKTRKIDFFYCVGTEKEAVFDKEIRLLTAKKTSIAYHRYFADVLGHLDAITIIKLCGGLGHKKIMLCGPVPMMNSLADQLKRVGVKNQDIIFEDFNLK